MVFAEDMEKKFDITGMSCSACSSKIQKKISHMEGVRSAQVNLLTNSMVVDAEDGVTPDRIIGEVEKLGYGASVKGEERSPGKSGAAGRKNAAEEEIRSMKRRLIVSFAFLIPLMYVSMGHMVGLPLPAFLEGAGNGVSFAFVQFLLCLPVLYVNRKFFFSGYKSLFRGAPNMDTLIAVGSSAAMVYGIFEIFMMSYGLGSGNMELVHRYHMDLYFESSAMILALITLGKFLEARSKGKTGEAIQRLMDLSPRTALRVEADGTEKEIPAEELRVGDIFAVKPGMTVPADGVVLQGSTAVDESMLTGESVPAEKTEGDTVTAATLNKLGYIRVRAEKVGEDTAFRGIVRLVEEASAKKAPISKLADQIAGVFVPVVMGISLLTFLVWIFLGTPLETALSFAITVLVISCPCALGLATPVAIMVGTGKGAENGILIKSGEALETAHKIDTVVFDKTGTITKGKPVVTDLVSGRQDRLLSVMYGLESSSEHPLAEAITEYCKERKAPMPRVEEFSAVAGFGVRGLVDGKACSAGSLRFMKEQGVDSSGYEAEAERFHREGKTAVFFAEGVTMLGCAALADEINPTAAEAAAQLKAMGVELVMLTGDNRMTAEAVAARAGIEKVIAQVLPQDKEREVSRLREQGKVVAMVGDGINDAPALAAADVGLAIGAGTDVAIESADIVLMRDDITDVPTAIRLSKAVIRNIRENLFWAFFYNVIGIPIAAGLLYPAFGFRLSPMLGALAMSLSSVCVVTNALRLRRFGKTKKRLSAQAGEESSCQSEVCREMAAEVTERKEETTMKTVKIEGMMCMHCVGSVKKALEQAGIEAEVKLDEKCALIPDSADQEVAKKAIEDAGYEVISIQ